MIILSLALLSAEPVRGQPPPRAGEHFFGPRTPRQMRDYSWIYIDSPQPREIQVHDIITILVDEKSEVTINSRFNRQRTANLTAELKEFIRINEAGNLGNAASNSPTIDGGLQNRLQSTGGLTDQEGIRYRIAATVVDVLPNGNIVLEARKSIRSNRDLWEYSLTGVLRSQDIAQNNTAVSEDIANLRIVKRQRGKVYNSTRLPWGSRLWDVIFPF
jgi:flagellar L-ring protein precursor FlgH